MKAEEARALMYKGNMGGYDEIIAKIKTTAAAGQDRLLHYQPELKPAVIDKLKADGFEVEAGGHDRDGYIAIITWGR